MLAAALLQAAVTIAVTISCDTLALSLAFPLVVDPGKKIQALYGPGRIALLIDKEGVVRYVEEGMPDNEGILGKIDELFHQDLF